MRATRPTRWRIRWKRPSTNIAKRSPSASCRARKRRWRRQGRPCNTTTLLRSNVPPTNSSVRHRRSLRNSTRVREVPLVRVVRRVREVLRKRPTSKKVKLWTQSTRRVRSNEGQDGQEGRDGQEGQDGREGQDRKPPAAVPLPA